MDPTDSFHETPERNTGIIIHVYGDGMTFPLLSLVEASLEDTVAALKNHIFNKAEDQGFIVKDIDQESMIIHFQDIGGDKLCYHEDEFTLKEFKGPYDVVFLPCFL